MAWKFDNPWATDEFVNPWDINGAEAEKVLNQNANYSNRESQSAPPPTIGIFIENITKTQINNFKNKIIEHIPEMKISVWHDESSKKGQLYKTEDYKGNDIIKLIINQSFYRKVNLINKTISEGVDNYDQFRGSVAQWINIEQYINTSQKEFFLYALTHVFTEYIYAAQLKLSGSEYLKAHNPTLMQDLKVFDQLVQYKTPEWKWYEGLKAKKFIDATTAIAGGDDKNAIYIEGSGTALLRFHTSSISTDPITSQYDWVEFINIASWETYISDMANIFEEIVTYDKIIL